MKLQNFNWSVVFFTIVFTIVASVAVASISRVRTKSNKSKEEGNWRETVYSSGSVAADNKKCSDIGVSILKMNGSAVDAAIAALFCAGIMNPQTSGIGGGTFMLVYINRTKSALFYNGGEKAPEGATKDMFVKEPNCSFEGARSVAVPGELKAMYRAWQEHGRLPWKQLVQPAIDLSEKGIRIHKSLLEVMRETEHKIYPYPGLRKRYFHNGIMLGLNDKLIDPELFKTLKKIASDPMSFYNGTIANQIVKDIQALGGIITKNDLRNYDVKRQKALRIRLDENFDILTTQAPTGGAVIAMILKILEGFKFTPKDKSTEEYATKTYHRMVEAFKFAYAYRALLADPDHEGGVNEVVNEMISDSLPEKLHQKISDNTTHKVSYYGRFHADWKDKGTTHISVLSKDGDAVSVTSSINRWFGSYIRSPTLGIIYNDAMDDFSKPGLKNLFHLEPSPKNYIKPGKRMQSSMSPVILVDKSDRVRLVIGAAGGTLIPSCLSQVIADYLWFGRNLTDAIISPRVHHQLVPNHIWLELPKSYRLKQSIVDGLKKLGHTIKAEIFKCVVQAVAVDRRGRIHGMSDPRKYGRASGY